MKEKFMAGVALDGDEANITIRLSAVGWSDDEIYIALLMEKARRLGLSDDEMLDFLIERLEEALNEGALLPQ